MTSRYDDLVPLWHLLRSREEFARPDLQLLTVVSERGVDIRDLSGGRAPSEDLSGYRVVQPGDLVVNRLWARFGAYGVSAYAGIISPAYWVLELDRRLEPMFLHHLLRSAPYRAEIWRRSKDQPPNGFELPWDQFRTIRVPVPTLEEQQQIIEDLQGSHELVRALDRTKDALVRYEQSYMAEIVSGRLRVAFDDLRGD